MSTDKYSIEEVIKEKGFVVITTSGFSMYPMLRDRRDTVEIRTVSDRPVKYDVVLFRRGKDIVLHRIVRVTEEGYLIRGDNCFEMDEVSNDDVIGILCAFTRNGRKYDLNDVACRIYARFIVFVHPVLVIFKRIKIRLKRFFI